MDRDTQELSLDVLEHGEAMYVLDSDFRIVLVNRNLELLTKRSRADLLGKIIWEAFPNVADPQGQYWLAFHRAVDEHTPVVFEEHVAPLAMWTAVNVYPTGQNGIAVFFRDVTERKRAEAEREQLLKALRERDRRKTEFLGMLSHELRNPLEPISNSVFVLEHVGSSDPQAKRARAIIDRQVRHMTRLIDDLLDITRVSRGTFRLQRKKLDLGELVATAVDDAQSGFTNAGVDLSYAPPKVSIVVDGDPVRLAQVVDNLLSNAAKFTPAGGKTDVALRYDEESKQAVIGVRDTGIGVPADVLPKLFEPFSQADATLDRTLGGLGLGLALTKEIVEMHGGSAMMKSEGPNRGTEVTIRLPGVGVETVGETKPEAEAAHAHRRVLIIEDNPDAAETLRDVLVLVGNHEVEIAHDGAEGIARAHTMHPEVVLCDIGLPGMSGYEVAGRLRSEEEFNDTRLVALSGYASPEDVARAKQAGFDLHLAKPPSLAALSHAIE